MSVAITEASKRGRSCTVTSTESVNVHAASVEHVTVMHEQLLACRHDVLGLEHDRHAHDLAADQRPEFVIVVARDEDDFGAGRGESRELRDDSHMRIREHRPRLHPLEIDDVANEVDFFRVHFGEEVEEFVGTRGFRAEMNV